MPTWGSKQGLQSRLVHMTHDAQKLLKCCIRGLALTHPCTDAGPALCPGDEEWGLCGRKPTSRDSEANSISGMTSLGAPKTGWRELCRREGITWEQTCILPSHWVGMGRDFRQGARARTQKSKVLGHTLLHPGGPYSPWRPSVPLATSLCCPLPPHTSSAEPWQVPLFSPDCSQHYQIATGTAGHTRSPEGQDSEVLPGGYTCFQRKDTDWPSGWRWGLRQVTPLYPDPHWFLLCP